MKGGEIVNIAAVVNMGNNIAIQSKEQQQCSYRKQSNIWKCIWSNIIQSASTTTNTIPNETQQNLVQDLLSSIRFRIIRRS